MNALVRTERYALIVGGHTHHRMVCSERRTWLLNAGTLSRRDEPGFAIVDLSARRMTFFDVSEVGVVAWSEERALDVDEDETPKTGARRPQKPGP